jgi:hypothetical protein
MAGDGATAAARFRRSESSRCASKIGPSKRAAPRKAQAVGEQSRLVASNGSLCLECWDSEMKIVKPTPLALVLYFAAAVILVLWVLGFEPGWLSDEL